MQNTKDSQSAPKTSSGALFAFEDLYEKLNAQQKEAVDTTEGPVMVIAGAGTGKTQILAMRIANILNNPDLQMDPQNILCLTFTESGVAAMRERLISIIGSAAYYVKIHTFHSFCNEVIKAHPEKFLQKSPKTEHESSNSNGKSTSFISELEQIEVFDQIIDSLPGNSPIKPYGEPYFYRYDLINNIKTLKREAIKAEDLLSTIESLEAFLGKNKDSIEEFISRHARTIKEEDCNEFIQELIVKNQEAASEPYTKLIEQFKAHSEKISEFKKQVKDFYEKNLKAIPKQKDLVYVYKQYQEILERRKLYDFEDMILWVVDRFDTDKGLLARYQEQFQYILVDEYQDTNGAQNKILDKITEFHGTNANIFVVGDDDQAIYRFQGANIENIVHFYRRYKENAKFIVLENNYRSQQKILDASYSVIENNQNRISNVIPEVSKKLTARAGIAVEPIEVHEFDNIRDEFFFVANKIKDLIKSGIEPKEIAVLYRDNKDVNDIIDYFSRLDVPFKVEAGNDILKNVEIIQLIDLLKLIHNPNNENMLFNILNYDFIASDEGFTPYDVYKLTRLKSELARKENSETKGKPSKSISLLEVLLEDPKFKGLAEKILYLNKQSHNLKFDEFFELVIKHSNYLYYAMGESNKIEQLNRLNTLFDEVKSLTRFGYKNLDNKAFGLKDFLEYIELLQNNNLKIKEHTLQTNSNAVNLMTAHKSKGLEYEHVFVIKCTDKHWGNKREISKLKLPTGLIQETESSSSSVIDDKNEDERRLFYVALTRAKKMAYVSYAKHSEKAKANVPSIFAEEIAKDHILKHDKSNREGQEESEAEKLDLVFKDKEETLSPELQEQEFVKECLKNYKLSVTHLNNYLKCPRLFFYQNLIRVPTAKVKYASFGTAVHAALYDLFVRNKHLDASEEKSSAEEDLKFLLNRFEYHLSEEMLNKQDYEDSLDFGKQTLTDYYEYYKGSLHTNSLLEYDFSTMGLHYEDLVLTGKLDKIEILDGDKVNVVDYKTGNPSNKNAELKAGGDYHRQVAFYKLLCDLAHESKQFNYQMQSGEIDFIQATSDKKFIKKRINITEEDTQKLKEEIQTMSKGLRELNFDKTEDTKHCEKCHFYKLCWQ